MLPVMRELGLMTIFYDLNFGNVQKLFDESGNLIDKPTYIRRMERFMEELIWMATVLRYGRKEVSLDKKQSETTMVHHANKPCPEVAARMGSDAADTILQVSQCSQTGRVEGTPIA
jgi:hypothetical protein